MTNNLKMAKVFIHCITMILIALLIFTEEKAHAGTEEQPATGQQNVTVNKDSSFLPGHSLKALGEYYSNSSDFTKKSAGIESEVFFQGGTQISAGYTYSDFSQTGFTDINRHRVFMQGETQISEEVGVAARISENVYDNNHENFNGGLFLRYHPGTGLYTEISFRHIDLIDFVLPFNNAIYSYIVTIGSIDLNIQSNDYKMYMLYYPASRVSLAGEITYGDYSDGNEKRSLMLEAGYQIHNNPHLRIAYNYFYLDIEKAAPLTMGGHPNESAYWDPVDFDTHTLRLEFRKDFPDHLTVGAEGALSYSPASDGISTTAFFYVLFRSGRHMSLRLDARGFDQDRGIDRQGKTGRFWAENYSMIINYRF